MAILYVFTIDDPNNSGAFPPSVAGSDWLANFLTYAGFKSIGGNSGYIYAFVFDNKSEIDSWIEEYGLTDDSLLSDLRKWTVDHQVTYSHKFYTLTDTAVSGLF
jgi:hypothetical protein